MIAEPGEAPRDALDAAHAVECRLVGEYRSGNHVTDGVNAWDSGLESRRHGNTAFLIQGDPDPLETKPLRIWPPPHRDEHHVGNQGFASSALGGLQRNEKIVGPLLNGGHLGAEAELQPRLLETLQ